MDEFEDIVSLYKRFQEWPTSDLAQEIELKLDLLKIQLGYRFETLAHFQRIGREVGRFLDKKEVARRLEDSADDFEDLIVENGKTLQETFS